MKTRSRNILSLFLFLFAFIAYAQTQVTGIVKSGAGEPLGGVTVIGSNGEVAVTDDTGAYTINAAEGESLTFSFLGMDDITQTVSGTTMDVSFVKTISGANIPTGEGVVITALGVKREKKALGYAAQEVKGELLSGSGQLNAVSALSGNIAGVQVNNSSNMGGSSRITLRGIGSVTGENRPLIVIDGIPLDNSNYNETDTERGAGGRDYGDAAFDINPNDIESVTVLKGGPAAALYGSRGGNGVILYTTKSAKKSRTEIVFNSGIAFESVYKMPKQQQEYGGGSSDTFEQVTINGKVYNIADYATDESWGPKYDPTLMHLPWNAFDPEFADDYLIEKPWVAPKHGVKDYFETGVTYNNNVTLAKSFESLNLRASIGHTSMDGIFPNSSLKKTNFGLNVNSKFTEKLIMEAGLNYVYTKAKNRPEIGYGDNSVAQKFFQWGQTQLDYNDLRDYKLADGSQRSWNRNAWDDATPVYSDNPYWIAYENISHDIKSRVFGNVGFDYKFLPQLTASTKFYYDTYSLKIDERVAIGSQAQSEYSITKRNFQESNAEARLTYIDSFFDKNFSITAFAGVNQRNNKFDRLYGSTVGGLVIPDIYNLGNSVESASASNYDEKSRVNSAFGMLSLGYKDFLFFEGTARKDWFSAVKDPGFYPSVSGSLVFSKLINKPWLTFGKVRGGWAKVSSAEGAYRLEDYADNRISFNGVPRYTFPDYKNNPDLKPEFKTTKEIGLEARFFKNRFGFDVTLYKTNTTDLITGLAVDPAFGYPYKYINAGEMENKGIEAMVNISPIRTKNFSWDIVWNFAKNENKLLSLYEEATAYNIGSAPFRVSVQAVVGQPYGQIYGTDFTYDKNGNKIIGSNGLYVPTAIKSLGSILPDYTSGLRNTLRYKDISLSALIDMQKGGKYFSTTHMWGTYTGVLENTAANGIRENGIVLEGVLADGTVNTQNISAQEWAVAHYNNVDAQNVFDADFFKLREVSLTYNLPKNLIGEVLEGIQISAFARNLLVWGLDWDIDPEQVSNGSGNIQGLEGGSLPSTRTYGFNVQFKF